MSPAGATLRLAAVALALLALVPVQWLGLWLSPALAGRLPMRFHRLLLAALGVRVRVVGTPPSASAPSLVLANHVSWLDIPVIGSLRPLSFIAKSEIAGWPVVGRLSQLQRSIFIDRSRRGATAEVNALVAGRLSAGEAVVLFPEGTTGDGLRLLPFRSSLVGAAKAALASAESGRAVRIHPLALAYTRMAGLPATRRDLPDIAWYGDMELGPHLKAYLRRGPADVVLVWGEPIPFGDGTDRKRATALAEAAIGAALRAVRAGTPPARLFSPAGERSKVALPDPPLAEPSPS